MFKSLALTNDIQEFLENTMEDPETFIESKDISDEKKKEILEEVLEKSDTYLKENDTQKNTLFDRTIEKVRKCFHKLPKNSKKVAKIKNIRESKNRKALIGAIGAAAAVSMVLLGTQYLTDANSQTKPLEKTSIESAQEETLLASIESIVNLVETENKKSNANMYDLTDLFQEETSSSIEKENASIEVKEAEQKEDAVIEEESEWSYLDVGHNDVDFGDTFTAGTTVYTNQDDMAKEENGVTTYFDALSKREIAGIVYNYNGENITIFDTDIDAEAKKQALENNGAKQIGFVGRNENASRNGYEGYFADDDVSIINSIEGALARGGR